MLSPRIDSSSSSTSLIIDLVHKFISKMFDHDPNHNHYIKQWNSFRDLLSAVPFDLNPIFSYIASINTAELNAPATPQKVYRPSHSIETAGPGTPTLLKNFVYTKSDSRNPSDCNSPLVLSDELTNSNDMSSNKPRRACSLRPGVNLVSPSKYAFTKGLSLPYRLDGSDEIAPIPDNELFSPRIQQSFRMDANDISSPLTPNLLNFEPQTGAKSHRQLASEDPNGSIGNLFKLQESSSNGSRYNLSFLSGVYGKFKGMFDKNSESLFETMVNKNSTSQTEEKPSEFRRGGLRKVTLYGEKKKEQQQQQEQEQATQRQEQEQVPQQQSPYLQQPYQIGSYDFYAIKTPIEAPIYKDLTFNNFQPQTTPSYNIFTNLSTNGVGTY